LGEPACRLIPLLLSSGVQSGSERKGDNKMVCPGPLALIILDGYGLREEAEGNAVKNASTPNIDRLFAEYPNTYIKPSGEDVGLPDGQMGNSEVGHLNIGAGRIVYQDYTRINKAIDEEKLKENEVLNSAIERAKENNGSLHLMGLLSDGGVHSHIRHLFGLLEMIKAKGVDRVYIHAILDGRDTSPRGGITYMKQLLLKLEELGIGKVATVSGRYYTMDRDNRWERIRKAYETMVLGKGNEKEDPLEAINDSYADNKTDEFVIPAVIMEDGKPVATINNGDVIIFFNFRSDRARQITRVLGLKDFNEFPRERLNPAELYFVCMTEYDESFNLPIAFPPVSIKNGLGEILSNKGLNQLRIAETEKYAHVTFFFNGGVEKTFPGEERKLIPSPKVATYDLMPEMSAYKVTDALLELLDEDRFDVIILNYANSDMVGHTGIYEAAVRAVEAVDKCIGRLVPAILEKGGQILLTADHGNSEKMIDEKGEPFTAHTTNPVPLIYIGGPEGVGLKPGRLADIAPTMLNILEIEIPEEMTGQPLLKDIS